MAVKLNLLPPGVGVTGNLGKGLKITRMLGVVAIAVFLVFTLGLSAFFILSTISLRNLNSDLDSLKGEITALEATEQQAVLLKDRIGKIKTAMSLPSSIKNLDAVNPLISNLPATTSLNELNIDSQKVDFSIQFGSVTDLSTFMSSLSGSAAFTSVIMTSFGYSPTSGYLVGIRLGSN